MSSRYNASDIEVLSGLDPVKRRPGMYTDTSRPNHLAQEVVDNSVDEALAGHAREIEVVLHADGSCEVADDGRGMDVVDKIRAVSTAPRPPFPADVPITPVLMERVSVVEP